MLREFRNGATCFAAEPGRHSHLERGENGRVIAREDVIRATWRETNPRRHAMTTLNTPAVAHEPSAIFHQM